jgi:uncharacterized protein
MPLPSFRYHPDPVLSGSVTVSTEECRCCGEARGYLYTGPVYSEEDLDEALCPWCIADGSASAEFAATFVDTEAFPVDTPERAIEEISQRTPGYSCWQSEEWPSCCEDATAYVAPVGVAELHGEFREFEGSVLNHIIHGMSISGAAATRLLGSLNRERGPTAYLFRCLHCERHQVHIDHP